MDEKVVSYQYEQATASEKDGRFVRYKDGG